MSNFIEEVKERLGFLFNKEGFEIVRKFGAYDQPVGNSQLRASNGNLEIKLTRDRSQFFIDIKSKQMKESEWASVGLLSHVLYDTSDFDEMMDGGSIIFLKKSYDKIKEFFDDSNLENARKRVKTAKTKRGKLLFGN